MPHFSGIAVQYDLLITNGRIVTLDPVLGDLSGADIVVRNGSSPISVRTCPVDPRAAE